MNIPDLFVLLLTLSLQQETIFHARRLFALNFNHDDCVFSDDNERVFHQEICFSYACKMLNSVGPRLLHFSGAPASDKVVEAELHLALTSMYNFGDLEDNNLFCYETME
jgi:hypothetical protein